MNRSSVGGGLQLLKIYHKYVLSTTLRSSQATQRDCCSLPFLQAAFQFNEAGTGTSVA